MTEPQNPMVVIGPLAGFLVAVSQRPMPTKYRAEASLDPGESAANPQERADDRDRR